MLLREYLNLTAPRITLLIMLTGFAGLWISSGGTAKPSLILWTLAGIGLASGGASVFNNYYDRDIDRLMKRTSHRPLPCGKLNPARALVFGFCLSATAFSLLYIFVEPLCAFLAVFAIFIYAFLYTVILKRHTPLATEIGGVSGALAPVIGWIAGKGNIGVEALMLFAMMFFWQPPHFWSLAVRHMEDYEKAGIPTLYIVRSEKRANSRSLIYIMALAIVSVLPYSIGMTGRLYLLVALSLGSLFILLSLVNMLSKKDFNKQTFYFSIAYVISIFIIMSLDNK